MPINALHEKLGLGRGRKMNSSPPPPSFYFSSRLDFVHGPRVETAGGTDIKGSQQHACTVGGHKEEPSSSCRISDLHAGL